MGVFEVASLQQLLNVSPLESRRSGSNGQAPSSERVAYTGKERRLLTKCLLHTLEPPQKKRKKKQQQQTADIYKQ